MTSLFKVTFYPQHNNTLLSQRNVFLRVIRYLIAASQANYNSIFFSNCGINVIRCRLNFIANWSAERTISPGYRRTGGSCRWLQAKTTGDFCCWLRTMSYCSDLYEKFVK
jgi:hypothetical protein